MLIETLLGSASFALVIGIGVYFAFRSSRNNHPEEVPDGHVHHRQRHRDPAYKGHSRVTR